jgi:Zn ribbon nucleic-acid-binding protein
MGYTSNWKPIVFAGASCPKCNGHNLEYCDWESDDGAHEDQHQKCLDCGHNWWIEGSDA